MDFAPTPLAEQLSEQLSDFVTTQVIPAIPRAHAEIEAAGDPHHHTTVIEELKTEAKARGLWNLFMPDPRYGPALSNLDYAPLCEILGSTPLAPEATNCAAPDTGNMEVLAEFGTDIVREQYLQPLVDGDIRSCFAMTEPWVASSDATNIVSTITRDGDDYIVRAHKWFTTGAASPRCAVAIVMGVSDPDADRHRRHSMVVVPMDAPGVSIVRSLPVYGRIEGSGHCETLFDGVRVPKEYLLGEEGGGFAIAQARLGPGRIHHCMRAIGAAEHALRLMCERAQMRTTFGTVLADQGVIQTWIAESRIAINQARLLTLKAAWKIDIAGKKAASQEIGEIKVAVTRTATKVIDHAVQVFGAAGVTDDWPLAEMWANARTLQLVDGPDEVHLQQIARRELRQYEHLRP
ncbi:MAG: acyl-CoA dehydrogenase family protein [Acidimicrobiia bacterium]